MAPGASAGLGSSAAPVAPAPARPSPLVGILGAIGSTALDAVLLAWALGGFAPLLAHRRAMALLFVWFVGALALALARPVRPRAGTLRRADPLLMIALFVIPIGTAPLAAWGERLGLWPLPSSRVLADVCLGLVVFGQVLRISAMKQLGSRFDPTVAILSGHVIEQRGLYARMRHPGYAGAWLTALGGALLFHSALGLIPAALFLAALVARARAEERALEEHFGDDYRVYRKRTGGFFPR